MKVEINIESNQMGATVIDMFKNISPTVKKNLAKQIMTEWLREPWDIERQAKEKEVFQKMRDQGDQWDKFKEMSEDQLRAHYKFSEHMRNYKSTKEVMIESITAEITRYYKEQVNEVIQKDPQVQAAKNVAFEAIEKDFPRFIQDALTSWFVSHMHDLTSSLQMAQTNSGRLDQLINEINQGILRP